MCRKAEERKRQATLEELGRLTSRVAARSGMGTRTLETIREKSKEVGDARISDTKDREPQRAYGPLP
jgi:hypothetical protein